MSFAKPHYIPTMSQVHQQAYPTESQTKFRGIGNSETFINNPDRHYRFFLYSYLYYLRFSLYFLRLLRDSTDVSLFIPSVIFLLYCPCFSLILLSMPLCYSLVFPLHPSAKPLISARDALHSERQKQKQKQKQKLSTPQVDNPSPPQIRLRGEGL